MGAVVLLLPMLLLIDRPGRNQPVYQAEALSAGDVHVRALRTGRGDTTILMLHGYGESLLAFRNLIGPLATKYRVLAMDLPASGRSEVPESSYTLEAMTTRVERVLDQWTSGPVVVVGHSMGGEIAAALALRRPERIIKVILIAPAGNGLGFGLTDEPFSDRQQAIAGWSLKARELLIPVDDPAWLANPPDLSAGVVSDSAERFAAGALLEEFDFSALRGRFRELARPTLLIWGKLDPLIPVEIGRAIAEQLPCGRWVEIGNAWHRPHVEQPERVAREITDFIAEREDCAAQ